MWSWSLLSCPLQLKVIFYVSFTFRHPIDIFSLSLDVSRCVAERKYTQEQARKEFQQVFIPECNDDGTYSQVNFFIILHVWKMIMCVFVKGEEERNVKKCNFKMKFNLS